MHALMRLEDEQVSEFTRLRISYAILVDFINSVTLTETSEFS